MWVSGADTDSRVRCPPPTGPLPMRARERGRGEDIVTAETIDSVFSALKNAVALRYPG